jgi:hypothetical protein
MPSVLNQRFLVTRWGFLALAALSASALASQERSVVPQNPAQPVKVTVARNGGLSIQVNASPIAAALDAVSAKSGVPIHYQGAPEQPVSLTCHGATLRSLLFCLLGTDADLVFQYGERRDAKSGREVESVTVLATTFGASAGPGEAGGNRQAPAPQADAAGRGDAAISERALALLRSGNPERRVSGLEMLREAEGLDPDVMRSAYQQALQDANGEVRAAALQGLATLDRDNSFPVLREAMGDADSSVRLAAVDGMDVNDESRPFLEQALKDADESVRELAGLRLGLIH